MRGLCDCKSDALGSRFYPGRASVLRTFFELARFILPVVGHVWEARWATGVTQLRDPIHMSRVDYHRHYELRPGIAT